MTTRRDFLTTGAALAGGATALSVSTPVAAAVTRPQWEKSYSGGRVDVKSKQPGMPGKDYIPVVTPGGKSLPWKIVDGVKVFHLIAENVDHEFAPGLKAKCWGYNGCVNATTIEAVEGDHVRIYVTNRIEAPTTVHWHGLYLPNGMDGVGGLNQRAIKTGETFKYEFTLRQHGTFMYHSHHDEMTQMGMGLIGMFIIHPRNPEPEYRVDRDFVIMLSEWRIDPGTSRPNTLVMSDFNVLTMNARCFPGTQSLVIKKNDRVRIRFGNLGAMDHHPIHLHGYHFKVTATDGGRIHPSAQRPETSVLVAVGQTRDVEFIADAPGDWAMHCHMTHHVMNQMGHDIPNMVGVKPGDLNRKVNSLLPAYMTMGTDGMGDHGLHVESGHMKVPENSIPMVGAKGKFDYITMGGMFSILKVRENLASYDKDPGWYDYPKGTVADVASTNDMRRDGIDSGAQGMAPSPSSHEGHAMG